MNNFLQDLRFAARMLVRAPGFTTVAVLTLALGIGANTAIFSVVNAVLLRPLPFPEPQQLVSLLSTKSQDPDDRDNFSYPNFQDIRKQSSSFQQLAAYREATVTLTGRPRPEEVRTAIVSADVFPLLRVRPELGRVFRPEDDQPNAAPVVLIGHGFWQRTLGGTSAILGSQLILNGKGFSVAGVLPAEFQFPVDSERFEVWLPMGQDPDFQELLKERNAGFFQVIGRLQPGVSVDQAQSELELLARRIAGQYPENAGLHLRLRDFHEEQVSDASDSLVLLMGAVGLVLLIACANVANLLLARGTSRRHEFSVRSALGGTRWRLVRQLLTESLLLAFLGGVLGTLLAYWATDLLIALLPEANSFARIAVDTRVLQFTLVLALFTGLLYGVTPALAATRSNLSDFMRAGHFSLGGVRHQRTRSLLVIGEVTLALALLVGAGLLGKSFWRLSHVHPGFQAENLLTTSLSIPQYKYKEGRQQAAFFEKVLERASAIPGVRAAAAVLPFPLTDSNVNLSFEIEGRPPARPGQRLETEYHAASPDYFRLMGIPVRRGRAFTAGDDPVAPAVVILSETFARKYFPGEDPVGKRMRIGYNHEILRTVVGVVGDVKHASLAAPAGPALYAPYTQTPWWMMSLVLQTSLPPEQVARELRKQMQTVDADIPLLEITPVSTLLAKSAHDTQTSMFLLGIFAGVSLLLAAVGIYGVMAFVVSQRTREIGIRVALGAEPGQVSRLVVAGGMRLAGMGMAGGIALALALAGLAKSQLFGVEPYDPVTLMLVCLLMAGAAFLACWLPARRAARIDPMVALRYE